MPDFVPGLELSERFYVEVTKPILEEKFPKLRYSAALLGWSSEVLGYDDAESTDHNWGPRFQLFVSPPDYERHESSITETFKTELPDEFRGYPTNFTPSALGDQVVVAKSDAAPVNHKIDIETVEGWFENNLGFNPRHEIKAADWLTFSEQKLLAFTSGKVFHDGLGTLEAARRKFNYYPHDVWLYLLACQWKTIAEEEAFVGRTGFVGDELGSIIVTARLVKNLMRLCFLMERRYAPYSKWFGTAFSRLKCGAELAPVMRETLLSETWQQREKHLSQAYEIVARLHNELQITKPLNNKVSKHGRPYLVLHARHFGEAILPTIKDEEIYRLHFFGGSVNQFVESDAELTDAKFCRQLKVLYE